MNSKFSHKGLSFKALTIHDARKLSIWVPTIKILLTDFFFITRMYNSNAQKNTQCESCVYKDSRKRKEEKSAKSKRLRRVLWERLDSLSLERKRLARLPAYLLYLFSPLELNRDKHRRDVRKSNLDGGRPHE